MFICVLPLQINFELQINNQSIARHNKLGQQTTCLSFFSTFIRALVLYKKFVRRFHFNIDNLPTINDKYECECRQNDPQFCIITFVCVDIDAIKSVNDKLCAYIRM